MTSPHNAPSYTNTHTYTYTFIHIQLIDVSRVCVCIDATQATEEDDTQYCTVMLRACIPNIIVHTLYIQYADSIDRGCIMLTHNHLPSLLRMLV